MNSIKQNNNGWHNQPKKAERPTCVCIARAEKPAKPQQDTAAVHTLL